MDTVPTSVVKLIAMFHFYQIETDIEIFCTKIIKLRLVLSIYFTLSTHTA